MENQIIKQIQEFQAATRGSAGIPFEYHRRLASDPLLFWSSRGAGTGPARTSMELAPGSGPTRHYYEYYELVRIIKNYERVLKGFSRGNHKGNTEEILWNYYGNTWEVLGKY